MRRDSVPTFGCHQDNSARADHLGCRAHPFDGLVQVQVERISRIGCHDDVEQLLHRHHGRFTGEFNAAGVGRVQLAGKNPRDLLVPVQGHVDQTAVCTAVSEAEGSWYYTFAYTPAREDYMTVEKGSVCVNGVSLTVVNSKDDSFQVAIIPYTYEHTNFHGIKAGTVVNLEFDIIGKYIARIVRKQVK